MILGAELPVVKIKKKNGFILSVKLYVLNILLYTRQYT